MNLGAGDDTTAVNPIDPRPVLIVTGLVQEARIAAGPGMTVICSSSDPQQLRENVARSGDRELALDLKTRKSARRQLARWRLVRGIVRGRQLAADLWRRFKKITSRRTSSAGQREAIA